MSTASLLQPPPGNAANGTAANFTAAHAAAVPSIWGDCPIPIIGLTGEFSTGKTLFGLTIDPGPRTIVWDNEGSSLSYKGIGFKHVDVADELRKKFGRREYKPRDRFTTWLENARACEPGQYTVGMIDPASEIESGLVQFVEENPERFGYSAKQFEKSTALLFGAVKDYWEQILDDLRTRFQTLCFVVHMREEFKGGAPTGKREPKGKETLWQLASLFLKFERAPNTEIPSAVVLKSRVAKTEFVGGRLKIVNCLPDRLPEATPDAIRQYIITPPDFNNLKANERFQPETMTEDERLRLRAYIAEKESEGALAGASAEAKRAKGAAGMAAALAGGGNVAAAAGDAQQPASPPAATTAATTTAKKTTVSTAAAKPTAKPAPAEKPDPTITPITDATREKIKALRETMTATVDEYNERFGRYKANSLRNLTELQGVEFVSWLLVRQPDNGPGIEPLSAEELGPALTPVDAVEVEAATAETSNNPQATEAEPTVAVVEQPTEQPTVEVPANTSETAPLSEAKSTITATQKATLQKLIKASGWPLEGDDGQKAWLAAKGLKTFAELSELQASKRIAFLMKLVGGDDVPFDIPK
jgi:hypothetical protein